MSIVMIWKIYVCSSTTTNQMDQKEIHIHGREDEVGSTQAHFLPPPATVTAAIWMLPGHFSQLRTFPAQKSVFNNRQEH